MRTALHILSVYTEPFPADGKVLAEYVQQRATRGFGV